MWSLIPFYKKPQLALNTNHKEIYIEHIHSHLFQNKLEEQGIEFRVQENHTGNFSEPFQTFYVASEQIDQAYKLLDSLSSNESEKAPIKHQRIIQVFMWVFTLAMILVFVFLTNLLLHDSYIGPEIWVGFIIILILCSLAIYGMYKSGAYFGKLK